MNYQASMSRYTPTPPPDYVAAEEALGTIRDTLTVHLDKVWKLALTDDHTVRCTTLALPTQVLFCLPPNCNRERCCATSCLWGCARCTAPLAEPNHPRF